MTHTCRTFAISASLCPILGLAISELTITFCWVATVIPRGAEREHFHYQGREDVVRFLDRVMEKMRE